MNHARGKITTSFLYTYSYIYTVVSNTVLYSAVITRKGFISQIFKYETVQMDLLPLFLDFERCEN